MLCSSVCLIDVVHDKVRNMLGVGVVVAVQHVYNSGGLHSQSFQCGCVS